MYKEKSFGFVWIFLGVCFLWDPVVGVADCLPDLLGWLFISIGTSALADINDDIYDAQIRFRRMMWVGLGRVAAELLVFVFFKNAADSVNAYEAPMWTLLLSFSFAVAEIVFLIPAARSFWRGICTLSECGGARTSLATRNRKGKSLCDRMLTVTVVFVILHAVLAVLPELSVLTVFRQENVYNTDFFRFRGLFRTVAGGISFVAGVVFLVYWSRLFSVWRQEVAWLESLRARYEREVLPNTGLLLERRMGAGTMFFRVGVLLSANLSIMYYEFLPDWGCVLIVLCGCLILGSLMQGSSMLVGIGLSLAVVGIPRTLLNVRYLRSYVPKDAAWIPEAYERYFPICVLSVIEAVLTALFVCGLLICLIRMSVRFSQEGDAITQVVSKRDLADRHRKAGVIMIFTILSAGGKIAEALLQPRYGWVWLVQFAFSIVAFVLFNGFLSDIMESIRAAYPETGKTDR